jgi:hypothetical protein
MKNIYNKSNNETRQGLLLSFSHFSLFSGKVFGVFTHPPIQALKNPLHILKNALFYG